MDFGASAKVGKAQIATPGVSLKPAKLTVLSANTLDIRRNFRHNHMLGPKAATRVRKLLLISAGVVLVQSYLPGR